VEKELFGVSNLESALRLTGNVERECEGGVKAAEWILRQPE
jgi:hypothetical protein